MWRDDRKNFGGRAKPAAIRGAPLVVAAEFFRYPA